MPDLSDLLELSTFWLEKASFEIRFSSALLHWDRAGATWMDVSSKWPELKMAVGEPSRTVFHLNRDFQVALTLTNATVVADAPDSSLGDFAQLCEDTVEAITRHLDVPVFSRIGLRIGYFREFPNREAAVAAALKTGLWRVPDGKFFGVEGKPTNPGYVMRWEGKVLGAMLRIEVEGRRVSFDPPFGIKEIEPVHIDKHGVTLDIDHYSTAAVPVGAFRAGDWIKQGMQIVRRDVDAILRSK